MPDHDDSCPVDLFVSPKPKTEATDGSEPGDSFSLIFVRPPKSPAAC